MKIARLFSSVAAACLLVTSVYAAEKVVSEESLGLRKVEIYTEDTAVPNGTNYHTEAPGTSKKFDRAYENAPPMISHDVTDFLPIEKNNNACLGCHMPEVAKDMGATPIPRSHFTNFRPAVEVDADDNFKSENNDQIIKKDLKDQLYQGRYNCSQCHAPQTQGELKVGNTFKPLYPNTKGQIHKNRSYLLDELDIGVKVGNGL
jgi:cytochrome c-type protein NapB